MSEVLLSPELTELIQKVSAPGRLQANLAAAKAIPNDQHIAFLKLMRIGFTVPCALEAMERVTDIQQRTELPYELIIDLMRDFKFIEQLRTRSIVSTPQEVRHLSNYGYSEVDDRS